MHTNDDKLLYKDEVFQIVGCAIEVLNTLGHGIVEKALLKMHSSWSFDYERFHFASPEGFRGRRHKSHRPNHRPRTWTDIELFADHEFACRRDSEFQTPEIGVGTNRVVNLCSFVSIGGWLDGRIKARTFLV